MNLFTHPKKKQTGQIGQPASKADSLLPPEPLAALRQLIAPMRERMKRYDEAIQALAVARDRLLDLEDLPPPDMTLAVERELLAARGDAEALRAFDAEHGESLAAEREQRMALSREREELPARVRALEALVTKIAGEMQEHITDLFRAHEQVEELFKPFAREALAAAQGYVSAVRRAHAAAHALTKVVGSYRYDLFGDLKEKMDPELYGLRGQDVLPQGLVGCSYEELATLNHALNDLDMDVLQGLTAVLDAAGLTGERLRIYGPPAKDDSRRIYVPENLQRKRVKQMPSPLSPAAAVVTIHVP
jgi:hypothetical protein